MKESLFCGCNVMYTVYVLFHILYLKIKQNKNEKKKKRSVFSMNRVANVLNRFTIQFESFEPLTQALNCLERFLIRQ